METEYGPHKAIQVGDLSEAKRRLLKERLRGNLSVRGEEQRIQPRPAGARIPISAEQHRIWLHASTHPDLPIYNEPITIHRRGSFDLQVLEASFRELLRRHEAWRTSFAMVNEELVQVVHPELPANLPFTDLSGMPAEARVAEALRLATEDAKMPIALDSASLFRVRVVRIASDDHRIFLTLHHIIFDGVSIYRIIMPELAAIYSAFAAGKQDPLPFPALQYGDYSVWRKQHISSVAVTRHLGYWRRQLSGNVPVLQLPVDRPRPQEMSHQGSMECFRLSAELIHALRGVARANGVTLYMTLLASFKALLFRYSGQEDIIVGGVTDARRRPELESVVGYFLDTLALRTHPSSDRSFAKYLVEVRDTVLGALAAADIPFDQVVQAVQPMRASSHHPVFQAFFSMEPPVAPFRDGWDLTQMDVVIGTSKFDLYLELDERSDHMACRLMYNTDIFDRATIQRMAGHWQVLLEAVSQNPSTALGALPLLTPDEVAAMKGPGGWNDTAQAFPQRTLHRIIESQAHLTPEKIAASCDGTSWTYAELMKRAEGLSSLLRAAGAVPGSIVAVFLHRSLDLLAGIIAILRTGAAYLPMDPETPQARVALCLEDAMPVAILTESSLRSALPKSTARAVIVNEDGAQPQWLPPLASTEDLDDIAYVIHTTGTTGRPKGVEISHASVVNLLASMQKEPGFGVEDTLLALTTISFDIAALELFLPLISGGRVVIATSGTARDPYLLAEAIESSRCTVMQATPSTWRALLSVGWRGSKELNRPLRVLCGGEPLTGELAERLLETGVELWNMYGPTETTIWSTVHRVEHGGAPIPIGRPIANTTAYILDRGGQLLPIGAPGELYLGGAGLARGYRGQPELTSERFNESEAADGARLYCTGDLAVWRANGTIECLGRSDNQVKVRGFRLELEAVEAAVLRHPEVEGAAARVWPDVAGGMRLSVYIVGRNGPPPDSRSLRQFLLSDLPDYMIPSDVVAIDAIPLTPNGKTNRALLPLPAVNVEARIAVELSTEHEHRLAAIWADLLRVQAVGGQDNFFDLGGHSLLVPILQQRIAAAFGKRLPMASLFHAPTVQLQANLLQAALENAPAIPGLIHLQPKGSRPMLFWLHPPSRILNLTAALGEDQPCFGLSLTEADMNAIKGMPSMESIAARHVQVILRAQPQGPYNLGGFCTGGIVAFEVAVQLRAMGHDVKSLILLDSQNPTFYKRIDSPAVELSKFRFYQMQALKRAANSKTLRQRLQSRAKKILRLELARTEMGAAEQITDSAAYRYKPSIYPGEVLLLQSFERPARVNYLPGWRAVISGKLIPKDVDGHHEELFAPSRVRSLAQEIALHLGA